MDKLDAHMAAKSKEEFHPAILSAMKLTHNKMDRYWKVTDNSHVYRIAMGSMQKYFVAFTTDIQVLHIVLHPGLKLEYFRTHK